MGMVASQITSLTIAYSIVYSDAGQRKHQSSASLAFVRGIHRGPVNSPYKWPVARKMFPFDDVIMNIVRMTPLVVIGDVEGKLQRPQWRPWQSPWRLLRFCDCFMCTLCADMFVIALKVPVDPQWNILYWRSKWIFYTVGWGVVGCEWGTTSVYFGIAYVYFIPSRLLFLCCGAPVPTPNFLIFPKVPFEGHTQNLWKKSM